MNRCLHNSIHTSVISFIVQLRRRVGIAGRRLVVAVWQERATVLLRGSGRAILNRRVRPILCAVILTKRLCRVGTLSSCLLLSAVTNIANILYFA